MNEKYETWEDAMTDELEYVWNGPFKPNDLTLQEMYDDEQYGNLASWAIGLLHLHGIRFQDERELLIRKQRDYGNQNILRFGEQGVLVRLWDKVSRYQNITGKTTEFEPVQDTLQDIVGYVVILFMVWEDTFALPLSNNFEKPATGWGDDDFIDWTDLFQDPPIQPATWPPPNGPWDNAYRMLNVGSNEDGHNVFRLMPYEGTVQAESTRP
jgi:hypothetical protein